MAKEAKGINVCFPDKNSSRAEKDLGIKILDNIIAENEKSMDNGKGGHSVLKKSTGARSDMPSMPEEKVDVRGPLLGETSLGDEI